MIRSQADSTMRTRVIPAVILVALVALVWPILAGQPEARNFVAHLSGDEEVLPRDTLAQGQAIFHLSKDGTSLAYMLIVANIENVVQAHIHVGAPGVNGPVVAFLFGLWWTQQEDDLTASLLRGPSPRTISSARSQVNH
jgi:CHRD domain